MNFKQGDTFNIEQFLFDKIAVEYIRNKDQFTEEEYIIIDNHLGLEYKEMRQHHYSFTIKDVNKLMLAVIKYGL
jgi:hypothetical protein